ncbi:MAG TPA: kynureninase [Acidimicrobiales bacterium]|nr:kynureninase [Acidimicrobiales bacterium]
MTATRDDASERDAADGLVVWRDEFVIDPDGPIYLDGNSLGRLPKRTRARLAQVIDDDWGRDLVGSWEHWVDLPAQVGDLLGASLLLARGGEVVMGDSTTVCLYKLASAALAARPGAIVTDAANFPTDRYVLAGLAEATGRRLVQMDCDAVDGPEADAVAQACTDAGEVALVSLSHVSYRSGALCDMPAITDAAHAAGALTLWDLCHSVGAVEVDLTSAGADLAVGCTYKYVNGGPGSPAFMYVRAELQDELHQPIWGWFAQRDQFAMGPAHDPAPGITAFLSGTPPILGLVAAEEGVRLLDLAGMAAVRAKSECLTAYAVELFDEWLAPIGASLGTPRDPRRRGAHVSIRHPDAERLCALLQEGGVVTDFRTPDSIRFGMPPLYVRFVDVFDAFDALRALLAG